MGALPNPSRLIAAAQTTSAERLSLGGQATRERCEREPGPAREEAGNFASPRTLQTAHMVATVTDTPSPASSKVAWRSWLRRRQPVISDATAAAVVAGLQTFIETLDRHLATDSGSPAAARLILFYRAMPNELSLDGLADAVGWQRFAVTRTPPSGPLTLHPATGAMERHRYGFPHPTADAFELQPRHISLALVPGMAFDRHGTRLGHGAGYYDELLARLPGDCPRVGVTCRDLLFDQLPSEPHDVPMTHLATEHGITALAT